VRRVNAVEKALIKRLEARSRIDLLACAEEIDLQLEGAITIHR
jgi:hypothetical protein